MADWISLRSKSEKSTTMIGATDAHVRIPNPSCAFLAFEKPMPRDRTNGTVTGPVVTPALSQAMFVKFSEEKKVKRHATEYLMIIKYMMLKIWVKVSQYTSSEYRC
jgi:hypothetical protein